MPQAPISAEVHKRILEVQAQFPKLSRSSRAAKAGVSEGTFSKYHNLPIDPSANPPSAKESDEVNGDNRTISRVTNRRIKTLADLIDVCEIDTTEWIVERYVVNKWEMGYIAKKVTDKSDDRDIQYRTSGTQDLFQVKAFLKRNKAGIACKSLIDEFIDKTKKHSPKPLPFEKKSASKSDVLVEISIVDHHFGALIWGKETGGADYDTELAGKAWKQAVISLLERTRSFKPSRILIVLGNDQQNADNKQGTTEMGTPQNMDSRYQKVSSASRDAAVWAVNRALLEPGVEQVHIVIVPGNHDPVSAWHLGEFLKAWYRNDPRVSIDNSPNLRKYYEYGVNMLLLTHGNKGKLENYDKTMAAEQPAMWGRTKWREAHTGDKHHRRMIETQGATVRILPSLRPPCSWSAENHYVGAIRAAEAYVWSKTEGLVGTACYSILDEAK